jgi:hypothetical protein
MLEPHPGRSLSGLYLSRPSRLNHRTKIDDTVTNNDEGRAAGGIATARCSRLSVGVFAYAEACAVAGSPQPLGAVGVTRPLHNVRIRAAAGRCIADHNCRS